MAPVVGSGLSVLARSLDWQPVTISTVRANPSAPTGVAMKGSSARKRSVIFANWLSPWTTTPVGRVEPGHCRQQVPERQPIPLPAIHQVATTSR